MYKFIVFCFLICFISSCKKSEHKIETAKVNIKSFEPLNINSVSKDSIETIAFPSKDGLMITADVYRVGNNPISILLCHQAGFSRGEYKDTALKLNELGYSVIAIDQRSGEIANSIINETAKRAINKNLPIKYLDARQDIEAAIDFVFLNNKNTPIVLVGSSYSASLALLIGESNHKIKAVAAFSPGEYFRGVNIMDDIKTYSKPVFVTSSLQETNKLITLVSKIDKAYLTHYIPKETGIHGSRALWSSTQGTENYWKAFMIYLEAVN